MLKRLKCIVLQASKTLGVLSLISNSRWRRQRLLILAYHGISQEDEHLWNPELFMRADHFRARMALLERSGCNVLPLADALERLRADDLPERSVVLTFDDGFYNFYSHAFPILRDHSFPATLYLTTYYCFYNKPVFDVTCGYILWKGRGRIIDGRDLIGQSGMFDLSGELGRVAAVKEIRTFARRTNLSAEEKDALIATLADRLNVDYESILSKRILHLLNPAEVVQLAAQGVDFQLHTHRHRTSFDRQLFLREIEDNKRAIEKIAGSPGSHFCYPSGLYDVNFRPWLRESGIASATTCDAGLTTRKTDQLLLPRLVDTSLLSPIEFEGWLSGISSILPRRTPVMEEPS
jgi:peptidoglycan/xylan/chitin deacetylase (PgdA/CDA1 family)